MGPDGSKWLPLSTPCSTTAHTSRCTARQCSVCLDSECVCWCSVRQYSMCWRTARAFWRTAHAFRPTARAFWRTVRAFWRTAHAFWRTARAIQPVAHAFQPTARAFWRTARAFWRTVRAFQPTAHWRAMRQCTLHRDTLCTSCGVHQCDGMVCLHQCTPWYTACWLAEGPNTRLKLNKAS